MEIESYEPYHIGSKLNPAINYDSLKRKLKDYIKDLDYSIVTSETPEKQIVYEVPVEVIATKNDIRIELNYVSQAINVIGSKPEEVTNIFDELLNSLSSLEYEIESTILFFEVISSIYLKVDEKPKEILGKSLVSNDDSFADDGIPTLNTVGIRMGGENPSNGAFITLAFEPSPTSPNSKLTVRVQYRTKDRESIIGFYEGLEGKIVDLVNKF